MTRKVRNAEQSASEGAGAVKQIVAAPSNTDLNIGDALSQLTGAREDRKMAVAVEEIEAKPPDGIDDEDTGAYSSDGDQPEENDQGTNTQVSGAEGNPPDDDVPVTGDGDRSDAWRAYLASDKQRELVVSYEKQITEFEQQQETGNAEVEMLDKMIASRAGGAPRKKALETELKALKERIARAAENHRITTDKLVKLSNAAKQKLLAAGDKERKGAQEQRDKTATSALARREEYHISPLTSEQYERRTKLEAKARGELDAIGKHTLAFCYTVNQIYTEKLWVDHDGGMLGYYEEAFGIKKSQIYRDIAIPAQMEALKAILSKEVVYLDATGKPEKVTLNVEQLPKNKGQLDKLARYGSAENQMEIWSQVVMECEANQIAPTEKLIKRIGDQMVATGEIAVGLDAELQKAQQEAAAARVASGEQIVPKVSPLVFNIWENVAKWGGHEFSVRSYKTQAGVKKFEPRVDHVPVQRAGEAILFDTLIAATKLLEEEARKLVTDEWTEDNPAPDVSQNGSTADVTATPAPAPVTAKGKKATTWYVGMDGDKPDAFDHDTANKGNPTVKETGYDAIVGPFPTKVEAIAYAEKIRTGAVKAPVAAAAA